MQGGVAESAETSHWFIPVERDVQVNVLSGLLWETKIPFN